MKIGIIGSGIVGQVLAKAFSLEHHDVRLGTRNPGKQELDKFRSANPDISIGTFAEVAAWGELLVLATNGSVTTEAIEQAGKENFANKVVIDTTNPIAPVPPVDGVLQFFTDHSKSLLEIIQESIPEARLVKAFNSVGNALMYKPDFKGVRPSMFICGNDSEAKATVTSILKSFGWDTEDMGSNVAARAIEPLCMLWCIPGMRSNQWTHAFHLLKQ